MSTVWRHPPLDAVPKDEREVKRVTQLAPSEDYLKDRQKAAQLDTITVTVLHREITARGYHGGVSQLRACVRGSPLAEPVVRFKIENWRAAERRLGRVSKWRLPLYALSGTPGFIRSTYVEFLSDMMVETLIACHEREFAGFGRVTRRIVYLPMNREQPTCSSR